MQRQTDREREREGQKERDRERERQRGREHCDVGYCVHVIENVFFFLPFCSILTEYLLVFFCMLSLFS